MAEAATLRIQVGDFTPNYLCNADAMSRIRNTATEPSRYRFVVVVREPVARAFSEWRSDRPPFEPGTHVCVRYSFKLYYSGGNTLLRGKTRYFGGKHAALSSKRRRETASRNGQQSTRKYTCTRCAHGRSQTLQVRTIHPRPVFFLGGSAACLQGGAPL